MRQLSTYYFHLEVLLLLINVTPLYSTSGLCVLYYSNSKYKWHASFEKKDLQRLEDLKLLDEDKKNTLINLIDTYIRDAKTRRAYAS
ncbi:hypothetical protein [Portibacter marinus]|uniref:hypothetical protein n=1 Tax=Portibacter marinus TaxID=2898660 RepID=UPI001F17A317|nr:hypothetical protein [Portibacter marinus]